MSDIRGPVHLVGIGGMHMSAIGQLLLERGIAVTGSDLRPSSLTARLESLGARVYAGHSAANLGSPALVVTTAAAGDDNPEIAAARERGIPVILRAEMVARLMEGKRVIAVAGSHGKTTTSSLVAFILSEAGLKPMYLLGGESIDLNGNAASGEGDLCVVEADEYRRAFHEYTPDLAVITNVEPDHLDYYGTPEAYHQAFVEFARKPKPGGLLLACGDDPGAMRVVHEAGNGGITVETYGFDPRESWCAGNPHLGVGETTFEVLRQGKLLGQLQLRQPGRHFIANALAATAACIHLGVGFGDIRPAVHAFRGAHRRFEFVGEEGGVVVMDDYAHHPTEVRATLQAARARFGGRRIIGVYQPHTYSRISYLWDEWTRCWSDLDALIVLETYAARETPVAGRSASDLARAIREPAASYAPGFDEAARMAADLARPGDVVFTIGAGDVLEVGPRILELLR
ncbi:MAG: UDP-N-acetylmuramate--L-alanine ligase [Chloroflexi bacterium CFX7]|nr:UDP-N-acetylmuramate--L-alanine ligase [Chloroflexi bacterium CFX7]MCK6564728.1 UDP-N-acetylmuramate--L-alanine ligase [Dehalococcoidia bacterium]MCL4231159.1 UDP-N-acetylmuramate--L-alanine ligase [Dehalococcoidia bacterium]RIL02689.1 MAG: UDP-N-acetylmuramate--L-alanine ligase [bacterium]